MKTESITYANVSERVYHRIGIRQETKVLHKLPIYNNVGILLQ